MQLVIADTSPINYLIQIGHVDVLPALFARNVLPSVVRDELTVAPPLVRAWISSPPSWVEVLTGRDLLADPSQRNLDPGEKVPSRSPSNFTPT